MASCRDQLGERLGGAIPGWGRRGHNGNVYGKDPADHATITARWSPLASISIPAISALLGETTTEIDVARKNRVFCNRNLRMDSIEMIGFDMDYTLALYHQDKLEQLSIELTLDKLCREARLSAR